ncbi:2-hydroxyacid dehydrogenase [Geminicoccus harenae]|uniref:2-hydroxyacid dehydrogenase n=1 Tax=Geminicoccus harenae TaxID=2498453 RepID=UPI001C980F43|nr:2-hydroxyacid dehydrogenase [Geminicoccus harenae]
MKPEILMLRGLLPRQTAQIEERYTAHRLDLADDREALLTEVAPRITAVVTSGELGCSAELMDRLPRLEMISCFGVGVDGIDLAYCKQRGIPVSNTPDVLTDDVADLAMGLAIATMRRIVAADRFVRAGSWQSGPLPLATRLAGKTAGIIGLGRIGKAIARRAEAHGLTVVWHGRHDQKDVSWPRHPDLVAMAREVDLLVVACPGGPATRGLVSKEVLAALRPSSFLVNISRGSVIDEPALVEALVEGRIAGAGLDVFADEPNVPAPLLDLPNVVLTPHIGSATEETRDAMAQLVVDNLDAHYAGRPLLTPWRFD